MMALPVDVAGLRPRLGDVEAPPKPRSSLSSMAEAESEPLGRARRRSSTEAESEPLGLGEAEFVVFRDLSPSPSPGSGEAEFVVFRGLARVRALGRAERSFLWRLWQGLRVKCSCNLVGWCGDLVRVAS